MVRVLISFRGCTFAYQAANLSDESKRVRSTQKASCFAKSFHSRHLVEAALLFSESRSLAAETQSLSFLKANQYLNYEMYIVSLRNLFVVELFHRLHVQFPISDKPCWLHYLGNLISVINLSLKYFSSSTSIFYILLIKSDKLEFGFVRVLSMETPNILLFFLLGNMGLSGVTEVFTGYLPLRTVARGPFRPEEMSGVS